MWHPHSDHRKNEQKPCRSGHYKFADQAGSDAKRFGMARSRHRLLQDKYGSTPAKFVPETDLDPDLSPARAMLRLPLPRRQHTRAPFQPLKALMDRLYLVPRHRGFDSLAWV